MNPLLANRWIQHREGQTTAEYAVVLGVITLAIITTLGVMSGSIQHVIEQIVGVFS